MPLLFFNLAFRLDACFFLAGLFYCLLGVVWFGCVLLFLLCGWLEFGFFGSLVFWSDGCCTGFLLVFFVLMLLGWVGLCIYLCLLGCGYLLLVSLGFAISFLLVPCCWVFAAAAHSLRLFCALTDLLGQFELFGSWFWFVLGWAWLGCLGLFLLLGVWLVLLLLLLAACVGVLWAQMGTAWLGLG